MLCIFDGCVMCERDLLHCRIPESFLHVLFLCPFAKKNWDLSPWMTASFDSSQNISFYDELQSSTRRINLPLVDIISNIFSWICWSFWLSWNQLIFDSKTLTQQQIVNRAITSCKEWESAQSIIPKPNCTKKMPCMPPSPTTDAIICHTDAAWNKDHKIAGLAWIFSTSDSTEISRGSSIQTAFSSHLMVEALAVREASCMPLLITTNVSGSAQTPMGWSQPSTLISDW